ncbi:MAG: hypothetical protein NTY19_08515 [Planctomycetota bacterium]|nr:hypothetical protein [Planctomycetota bacterium]
MPLTRMLSLAVLAAWWLPLAACHAEPRPSNVPPGATLGINLEGNYDWSTQHPFVDVWKTSRPWFSGNATTWQDQQPLELDDRGNVRRLAPGQIARTLLFWDIGNHFPAGRYELTYRGRGRLRYEGVRLAESTPGRDVLDLTSDQRRGFGVFITETDPHDYLRDFHLWLPGVPRKQRFNPAFLERLQGFTSIRYVHWAEVDLEQAIHSHWSERPQLDDCRWRPRGVPLEVMCELANVFGADPWFCVPHAADDDYVRQMAQLIRDKLDPQRRVYLEYSNEIWNGLFAQARYCQQLGVRENLGPNRFESQLRWYSRRARQVFGVWESVFPADKLVRVIAGQSGNAWVAKTELEFGDTLAHTDALAIAPYFGGQLGNPDSPTPFRGRTLDELFTALSNTAMPMAIQEMTAHAALAKEKGVALVAYEAGQHLVGVGPAQNDQALTNLFIAANRDPRMGPLYTRYLNAWRDADGQLCEVFVLCNNPNKHGAWGLVEWIDQPRAEAPKLDAVWGWMGLR